MVQMGKSRASLVNLGHIVDVEQVPLDQTLKTHRTLTDLDLDSTVESWDRG